MFFRIANATILIALAFGLPFFDGYIGRGIHAPIICTTAVVIDALWTGWRLNPTAGLVKSAALGFLFAAVVVFPIYGLGRFLGI